MTSNHRRLWWRRFRRIIAWAMLISFAGFAILLLSKVA
jgi:hypothetical protein